LARSRQQAEYNVSRTPKYPRVLEIDVAQSSKGDTA